MISGRTRAFVILGWSFFRVLFKLLFTKQPPGLEQFHDNYDSEGLSAIEPRERQLMARFSRCTACGRCDFGEAERISQSAGEYPGLMQLVLASTRSMPDFDAAARGFVHVPQAVLQRKVGRCPVRIPFVELARFVRGKSPDNVMESLPPKALPPAA